MNHYIEKIPSRRELTLVVCMCVVGYCEGSTRSQSHATTSICKSHAMTTIRNSSCSMAMRGHGSENGWGIKCRCSSGSSNNTHKEEEESREFVEANREDHWGEDTLF